MTLAVILLALVVVAVVIWQTKQSKGSSPVVRTTVDALHVQASPEPLLEAGLWAENYYHGRSEVTTIGATGSMKPLLQGGEVAVLAHDFDAIKLGQVVAYRTVAGSSPAVGSRLVHRIVAQDDRGWIPQGDTPGCVLEDWNPITRDNYIGTLVAVFKQA
jgi:hypothetical protein